MGSKQLVGAVALAVALVSAPAAEAASNGRLFFGTSMGAVYSVAADGSGARFVHGGRFPSVSPEGTHLAYVDQSAVDGASLAIWVANLDGSAGVELAKLRAPAVAGLAWSHDGTRIAFVSGDYVVGWKLLVVKTDGSGASVVAEGLSPVATPSWSPDGTSLAYTTTNEVDVAVAKADGSG